MPPRRSRRLRNLPPDGGELPLKKSQVASPFAQATSSAKSATTLVIGGSNIENSNARTSEKLGNPEAAVHNKIATATNSSVKAPKSLREKADDLRMLFFGTKTVTDRPAEVRQHAIQQPSADIITAPASGAVRGKRKSKLAIYNHLDNYERGSDFDMHNSYNFAPIPLANTTANRAEKLQRSGQWSSNAYVIKHYLGEGAPSDDDAVAAIARTREAGIACKEGLLSSAAFMKSSIQAHKSTLSSNNQTAIERKKPRRGDAKDAYARSKPVIRGTSKTDAQVQTQPAHFGLSSSAFYGPSGFKTNFYTSRSTTLQHPSNLRNDLAPAHAPYSSREDDRLAETRREPVASFKPNAFGQYLANLRTRLFPSSTTTAPRHIQSSVRHSSPPRRTPQPPSKLLLPYGGPRVHVQSSRREQDEGVARQADNQLKSGHIWQSYTKIRSDLSSNVKQESVELHDHRNNRSFMHARLDGHAISDTNAAANKSTTVSSAVVGGSLSVAHHNLQLELQNVKSSKRRGSPRKRATNTMMRPGTSMQNNDGKKYAGKKRRMPKSDDEDQ